MIDDSHVIFYSPGYGLMTILKNTGSGYTPFNYISRRFASSINEDDNLVAVVYND
jgi:hypothetical protein